MLCSALCWGGGLAQNGGPCAHSPAPGQSSPLGSPILWPQRRGRGGGEGNRCHFSGLRMDRVGGVRLQAGEAPSRGCLSRGRSRHLGRTWPRVPTARPGRLGVHLSGRLPPFSCERQAGRDWGLGTAICSGSSLCRDPGPTAGVEGEGSGPGGWGWGRWGADRRGLQGEGGSAGQGCSSTICAQPSRMAWAQPPQGPLPAPGQAAPTRGHPAPPRGGHGARVCPPGRPASVTGRPALGTVHGNHLWVTRRLSSRGTPSSTDLAWTPGHSSRRGPGLPRRGQEGTASLCRYAATRVPRKGGLRPLPAGTVGTGVGSALASDAPWSGRPPSLSGSEGADTERCFSWFQRKLLKPPGGGTRRLWGALPAWGGAARRPEGSAWRSGSRGTWTRARPAEEIEAGPARRPAWVLMCEDVDGRRPPGPSCRAVFIPLPSTLARAHSAAVHPYSVCN